LLGYAEFGTITAGLTAAGISAFPFYEWRKEDVFGFVARFAAAMVAFGDKLEDMALKRLENLDPKSKGGSDLLLIAMLNANKPDKWRRSDAPNIGGVTVPVTQIVINLAPGVTLPETTQATPSDVIEGASREIPGS